METFLKIADRTYKLLLGASSTFFARMLLEATFDTNTILAIILSIGFGILVIFILDTDFANPETTSITNTPANNDNTVNHANTELQKVANYEQNSSNGNAEGTEVTEGSVITETAVKPAYIAAPVDAVKTENTVVKEINAKEIIGNLPNPFIIAAGLNALLFVLLLGIQAIL